MWKAASEDVDAYYTVRPECLDDVPKGRFKPKVLNVFSFVLDVVHMFPFYFCIGFYATTVVFCILLK